MRLYSRVDSCDAANPEKEFQHGEQTQDQFFELYKYEAKFSLTHIFKNLHERPTSSSEEMINVLRRAKLNIVCVLD